jgi:hypothetical protein
MPKGVYVRTEQTRKNMSLARKNYLGSLNEDQKLALAESRKAAGVEHRDWYQSLPASKKTSIRECLSKGWHRSVSADCRKKISASKMGHAVSKETRDKLSMANKGIHRWSAEQRAQISARNKGRASSWKGKKHSDEYRRRMSESTKGLRTKEKAANWRGGITGENRNIRCGVEYKLWREGVFYRDNHTCQKCKTRGGPLHPHHILNFSQYREIRFSVDNGVTLCVPHHHEFHRRYGRENNTLGQLEEFLNV